MKELARDIVERVSFWRNADRIGPDIPLTHWRLHFKSLATALCQGRFRKFGKHAEFRAGAYAISCSRIDVGARVVIQPAKMLFADPREDGASIVINVDVLIGDGVHVYTGNHRFYNPAAPIIQQGHSPSRSVVLRRGCWIGAKAPILPEVEVGENAVVWGWRS